MITIWMRGIVAHRWRPLVLAACGIAIATAIVGVIGVFAISSSETMTRRALATVPVDWQVALAPGADVAALAQQVAATPAKARTVGYADIAGLKATTAGTSQTTGAGQVLGLPQDYVARFPGQIRLLQGSLKE